MANSPSDPIELPEFRPWRRTLIFLVAFVFSATVGLAYVYTRPAEYRAVIRIHIQPAVPISESLSAQAKRRDAILVEAQALTSHPVVQDAIQRLDRAGAAPDLGRDPVKSAQSLLHARVADPPNVVELSAEGSGQLLLERLLNAIAESYRDLETRNYEQQIAQEDKALREDVQSLQDRSTEASAKLQEFQDANPAITARAEKPVSPDLQNLKRVYAASTNDFAKSRAWLEALDKKIDAARASGGEKPDLPGQVAAIVAAVQQLQTNQARLTRLRGALAEKQREADDMSALISEYNQLQDDFAQAAQTEERAAELLVNLPASQRERAPVVRILQPALSSATPVRPHYTLNAWIAVAASVLAGFAAVRCASFFAGPPAVAFETAPMHMRSWDGAPALTYQPQSFQGFDGGAAPVRLLPAPDASHSA